MALREDMLHLISPKSVKKCGMYRQKFMHSLKYNMSVTESIFIKLTLALQNFVSNYNTEFNENPTNGCVTDTRPQTERQIYVAST